MQVEFRYCHLACWPVKCYLPKDSCIILPVFMDLLTCSVRPKWLMYNVVLIIYLMLVHTLLWSVTKMSVTEQVFYLLHLAITCILGSRLLYFDFKIHAFSQQKLSGQKFLTFLHLWLVPVLWLLGSSCACAVALLDLQIWMLHISFTYH